MIGDSLYEIHTGMMACWDFKEGRHCSYISIAAYIKEAYLLYLLFACNIKLEGVKSVEILSLNSAENVH